MKCIADLVVLKSKLSLIPLKILNNNKLVPFGSIRALQKLLGCYKNIINSFYKLDSARWAGFSGIGLNELDDHMKILVTASDHNLQSVNYNDCHGYLSASIQHAIDTVPVITPVLIKSAYIPR
jgi:hypothetical protein